MADYIDYKSKRTGEQIEALLDIVQQGGTGGGGEGDVQKTTEAEITAMGFTKNIGTITGIKMNGASKGTSGVVDLGTVITAHQDISGKVDKVTGKGLSTEDFTTALKQKLESLTNYDDTALSNALATLRQDFDNLVSGDTTTAIKTFNEIIAFLDGISDSEDLDSIIAGIEQQIAGKQATITDLETIRSGAAAGATAVQPGSLAKVAASGSYNDLTNKPTIPSSVTESTVSGWGFTKNTGTYSKPSGGIPKTDLASAVQTSLGKADTALQSYTEQYKGTVTGVKVNGTTYSPTNGIVDLGTISGGGSNTTKEIVHISNGIIEELEPNKIYLLESGNLIFEIQSIIEPEYSEYGTYAEYTVIISAEAVIDIGDETPTIILPEDVYWANGVIPEITEQGMYELSIVYWAGGHNSSYNAVLTKFQLI